MFLLHCCSGGSQEVFPEEMQAIVWTLPIQKAHADYKRGQPRECNCFANPNFGIKPFLLDFKLFVWMNEALHYLIFTWKEQGVTRTKTCCHY